MAYSIKEVKKQENFSDAPERSRARVEPLLKPKLTEEEIVTEALFLQKVGREAASQAPSEETRAIFAEGAIAEAKRRLDQIKFDLALMGD